MSSISINFFNLVQLPNYNLGKFDKNVGMIPIQRLKQKPDEAPTKCWLTILTTPQWQVLFTFSWRINRKVENSSGFLSSFYCWYWVRTGQLQSTFPGSKILSLQRQQQQLYRSGINSVKQQPFYLFSTEHYNMQNLFLGVIYSK